MQITSIVVNGQRREALAGLHLQPAERNLEVRYAGLSFVSPEKVTFRYMLDGFDKTWTDAGSRREAFFTNLPPGHFHFRVMARNADGVWSSHDAALSFTVDPRLYQRGWFFPAIGVLIAGIVAAMVRFRIARIKHRFDEVLAERSRIARELHDTLLQGLSGITMQLQAVWTRYRPPKSARCWEKSFKTRRAAPRKRGNHCGDCGPLVASVRLIFPANSRNWCAMWPSVASLLRCLRLNPGSLAESPEVEYQLL